MKCALCGGKLTHRVGTHHYIECGLDAIYLKGIDISDCKQCNESFVSLPKVSQLHTLIGTILSQKKTLLNGFEIRFLRKNLGLSAKKFSKYLSVSNATLSRWENDKQEITTPHDRLIRLIYVSIKRLPADKIKHLIEDEFTGIRSQKGRMKKTLIPMTSLNSGSSTCLPV